jgi:hypothetical protein
VECDFRGLPPKEIETACLYEYMRESHTLRDALNAATEEERRKKGSLLVTPLFLSFTEDRFFRLMVALQEAGFPKPWKRLSKPSQRQLVLLLAGSTERTLGKDKRLYPPVLIEEGAPEFDLSENCRRMGQLESSELSLFIGPPILDESGTPVLDEKGNVIRAAKYDSGRTYFFGFIRIDEGYNEREAVEAFRNWFKKRRKETKGGNRERWRAKLNNLVVMRLWHQFPNKKDAIERVEHVAKFTTAGFGGCKDYLRERRKAIREKREVEQRISNTAKVEMSSVRAEARTFFRTRFLFPRTVRNPSTANPIWNEEPLSW